jgi:hypothetical protein
LAAPKVVNSAGDLFVVVGESARSTFEEAFRRHEK